MKRYIFIIFVASLLVSSCHFLEVEHVGKSDIDGFYSDPNAMRAAVYGAHNLAYSFYDKYFLPYGEVAADELVLSTTEASWVTYQNFSNTSDDEAGPLGYIWKDGYQVISNCNQVIEHAPQLLKEFPDDEADINTCVAQALFLRALMHFDICLCYGQNYTYTPDAGHLGIPVVKRALALNEKPSRNTVAEVYDAVVNDLQDAIKLFPGESIQSKYLPSAIACYALLARVYLYKGDYENAAAYATKTIAVKGLVSRDSYFDMFYRTDPSEDESIYRLNGFKQSKTLYNLYWKNEPKARPSQRVLSLFDGDDDVRYSLLSDLEYGKVCLKYDCPSNADATLMYKNHIVLRASEMYLIRAEANLALHAEPDVVQADLDAIRKRAYGYDNPVSWETEADLARLIEEERIKELCAEGHRFWDITRRHADLCRTDDSSASVLTVKYPDFRFVLPIPSVELEANTNMKPNPGSNE